MNGMPGHSRDVAAKAWMPSSVWEMYSGRRGAFGRGLEDRMRPSAAGGRVTRRYRIRHLNGEVALRKVGYLLAS